MTTLGVAVLPGGVEIDLETAGYSLIATMQIRHDPVREAAFYESFINSIIAEWMHS